ncbi:MAG: hypothetical protein SFZ03_10600 [Candidatus Melainabacteria bacterium]|nr:hypothetical protein [Candidatus Melainabacteria bacterium]
MGVFHERHKQFAFAQWVQAGLPWRDRATSPKKRKSRLEAAMLIVSLSKSKESFWLNSDLGETICA